MKVIQPGLDAATSLAEIESAWAGDATFAVAPAKTGVARDWLDASLDRVTSRFKSGHFCLLSSGSTGAPKLMVGSKARAEKLARVLHKVQESEPVSEAIVALPLSYSYAFVNQWVWSRAFGRRLTLSGNLSRADLFLAALRRSGDAMLCLTGPQAPMVLNLCPDEAFPGILRVHFAGGRFPQEHLLALRKVFPRARIFNNYGCVEAMPRLTIRAAEDGADASEIGAAIPGVELRTDETSRLLFRSEYQAVAQADPQGVSEFADGAWIPTGDLAEPDTDDRWRLLGRAGEVFKRYGEKVALPRILTTVAHAWSGQLGTYKERDRAGEEGYVLVVAPAPSATDISAMLSAFRSGYGRAHWPLRIESLPAIPVLPNGKIDTYALQTRTETTSHWRQRI